MATLDDNNTILLFRVGPVLCCVPSLAVDSVITPPNLTKPPGHSTSRPGIFKFGQRMVGVIELRYLFGVEKEHWKSGRNIIATINNRSYGFWVDEILDVLEMPSKGWGNLPPLIPHDVFSRTLLLGGSIYLYTEVEKLTKLRKPGLLKKYIEQLNKQQQRKTAPHSGLEKNLSSRSSSQPEPKKTITSNHQASIKQQQVTGTTTLSNSPQQQPGLNTNQLLQKDRLINKQLNKQQLQKADTHSATDMNLISSSSSQPEPIKTMALNHQASTKQQQVTGSTTLLNSPQQQQQPEFNDHQRLQKDRLINKHNTEDKIDASHPQKITGQTTNINKYESSSKNDVSNSKSNSVKNKRKNRIDSNKPPLLTPDSTGSIKNDTKLNHSINYTKQQQPTPTLQSLTIPDKTHQWPSEKDHTASIPVSSEKETTPHWPLLMLFLLILGGAGYFSYNLYLTHYQQPESITKGQFKREKYPQAILFNETEELNIDEVETEQAISLDSMENFNKYANTSPVQDTTLTNDTKSHEAVKPPTKPITPTEDSEPPHVPEGSPYHADIARSGNEITIVLHEPEQLTMNAEPETQTTIVNEVQTVTKQQTNIQVPQPEHIIEIDLIKKTEVPNRETQLKSQKISTNKKIEIIHLVVKGDTLWAIAKRYVNNPFRYPELARLSKIKNPDLIYPGNRVRIIKYEIHHSN